LGIIKRLSLGNFTALAQQVRTRTRISHDAEQKSSGEGGETKEKNHPTTEPCEERLNGSDIHWFSMAQLGSLLPLHEIGTGGAQGGAWVPAGSILNSPRHD
jgi:hypothetical protein